jgi:hypothetical protein
MSQAEHELAYLRRVFASDAESIYRGLAVASREMNLSDALGQVLRVRDLGRAGEALQGLDSRIAAAMGESSQGGGGDETIDDLGAGHGPFARLRRNYATSRGVVCAGRTVRVLDRLVDGQILVDALDLNATTFPIPEALLEPTE